MRSFIVATLAAFTLLSAACTNAPEDASAPDDNAQKADDEVSVGTVVSAVALGCSANVNCTGGKTCGPWSAYTACAASFTACREGCGFITRAGCTQQATLTPQNRSRTCVMNATGQSCTEIDYRELQSCH